MNSNDSNGSHGLLEIISDVFSGILVGTSHSIWFVQNYITRNILDPLRSALGYETHNKPNNNNGNNKLKVVGVGYGRTGTYSLALALEELGYPTLHTQHMYENHAILDMWTNQVFLPSIENKRATLGNPNLDLIAQHGYQATTDLPTALYFESLLKEETKFILTTRETSEIWFKSWDMLTKAITVPTRKFGWMSHAKQINMYYRWLFSLVNQDNSYLTTPMPLPDQDEAKAIASYEKHNERVRELIPPHRLLEYSVKQGWEPLCEFLEIENCPLDKPFPKSNSALSVQVQAVSAMVVPITVVVLILAFLSRSFFVRRNNQKKSFKKFV